MSEKQILAKWRSRNTFILVLLVVIASRVWAQSAGTVNPSDLVSLKKLVAQLPIETAASTAVDRRAMARNLVEYGLQTRTAEAVVVGLKILNATPVSRVGEGNKAAELDHTQHLKLIDRAAAMQPGNELIQQFVKSIRAEIEDGAEKSRDLVGGPKSWTRTISLSEPYLLNPKLRYEAHRRATVTATTNDPTATLAIVVRRPGIVAPVRMAVANVSDHNGKATGPTVRVDWNPGVITTDWHVSVYRLGGNTEMPIIIEAS